MSPASLAHSGTYFAALGASGSLGYLSQTLATVANQSYLLSLWFNNPGMYGNTPNEFSVSWNGNTLSDQVNMAATAGWTNLQFIVTATGGSTVLQFGERDDPWYLGLDDVSVTPVYPPVISTQPTNQTILSGGNATFTVTAGGTSPLAFQWRENGTNISNGGNISGAKDQPADHHGGDDQQRRQLPVVITNNYGSITSTVAALTVGVLRRPFPRNRRTRPFSPAATRH